jgi:hypothetical protein
LSILQTFSGLQQRQIPGFFLQYSTPDSTPYLGHSRFQQKLPSVQIPWHPTD